MSNLYWLSDAQMKRMKPSFSPEPRHTLRE